MLTDTSRKTFAEFFAGIGLVHEGLLPGEWQCVYANDLDPKKREMYEDHFGESGYYHLEDIWKTDAIKAHLIGRPFLATASFPCVDLSLAGNFKGFDGERSSTYFGFLRTLEQMPRRRPRVVMLENVPGFLTSRNGDDFCKAIESLAGLGYWIDAIIVDAKQFVPQSRPRLFVFGYHRAFRWPHLNRKPANGRLSSPWHDAIEQSGPLRSDVLLRLMNKLDITTGWATPDLAPPKQATYKLMDLIDLDNDQDWWDAAGVRKHYEMMNDLHRDRVDKLVNAKATGVGTAYRRRRHDRMRTEVRFDNVAGCLRTPRGGSARQIVVAVVNGKLRMRWMSPREYARLQGADDYIIDVRSNQAMFGFGDAVCVPVIEWIDRNVLTPAFDSVQAVSSV